MRINTSINKAGNRDTYWRTGSGDSIKVRNIEEYHLQNLINFLGRKIVENGPNAVLNGLSLSSWSSLLQEEIKTRRTSLFHDSKPAPVPKPKIDIKNYFYNPKKRISTLIVGSEVVTVKLGKGEKYDEYHAFTALVTKYALGTQANIKREVGNLKQIGGK